LNQDGWDGRIDQEQGMNQDALRRRSGYGMRGWAKIIIHGRGVLNKPAA